MEANLINFTDLCAVYYLNYKNPNGWLLNEV